VATCQETDGAVSASSSKGIAVRGKGDSVCFAYVTSSERGSPFDAKIISLTTPSLLLRKNSALGA